MRKHGTFGAVGTLFSMVALGVLVGCGGSETSSPVATSRSSSVSLTIRWPDRTRLIPLAAQSIKVEIRDSQGTLLASPQVVARPAVGNTATVVFNNLDVQTVMVKATAYPNTDGTGVAQATGTVPLELVARQTANATVTMDSTIARVQINNPSGGTLTVGESRTLTAQALNAAGEVVLVDASQWEWTSSNTTDFSLTPSGGQVSVLGKSVGTTTLSLLEKESGKTIAIPLTCEPKDTTTRLAFWSYRNDNYEIYLMNADGSNQTQITDDAGNELYFVVSPDGKKIAYSNGSSDSILRNNLYVVNSDGIGKVELAYSNFHSSFPAFSPDSSQIVFSSDRDDPSGFHTTSLYTVNVDGSGLKKITNAVNYNNDSDPMFSPSGNKIIFSGHRNANEEIISVNPDGAGQVNLSNNSADDFLASISPLGDKILFVSRRDGNEEIYTMNMDGTGQTRLTNNSERDYAPVFSPDGTKIVYNGIRNGDTEVFIMNMDGSGQINLTNDIGFDGNPVFSPDGKKIAYQYNRNNNFEIFTMNIDGSNKRNISQHPMPDFNPVWFKPMP